MDNPQPSPTGKPMDAVHRLDVGGSRDLRYSRTPAERHGRVASRPRGVSETRTKESNPYASLRVQKPISALKESTRCQDASRQHRPSLIFCEGYEQEHIC